ncbi:hypothetical protein A0H81_08004 [Grifola frondosa]|uniref:Uncharacterized protein n=1 Tax=Grifola frondosa TaxID=5627 RepID=A0A1C7M693_GRIFR|nr:hypothetical protein A0H81_08004 [Grifola frondosa]
MIHAFSAPATICFQDPFRRTKDGYSCFTEPLRHLQPNGYWATIVTYNAYVHHHSLKRRALGMDYTGLYKLCIERALRHVALR